MCNASDVEITMLSAEGSVVVVNDLDACAAASVVEGWVPRVGVDPKGVLLVD